MKSFHILLILNLLHLSISAQTTISDVSGVYEMRIDVTNALIIDTLTLNADGTFVFHEYDKHDNGIPPERNKYAKGTWRFDRNLIYFQCLKIELDEKFTLNFNNSKARFIIKSPRDTSGRDVKTAILFYDSEIFWVKGRTLLKINL